MRTDADATAFWLLWYTLSAVHAKAAWLPLLACLGILLVKRLYWTPGLVILASALLVALVVEVERTRNNRLPKWIGWATPLVPWLMWGLFAADWHVSASCNRKVVLQDDRPVVCLGDSLTAGLQPPEGYPDVMADMLAVPVVNFGHPGLTTKAALQLLPAVKEANPQLVIIELGGHDYIQGLGRAATQHNLERLVANFREMGAEVVLMEIPRGFMTDPYWGVDREIARQHDLQLISDAAIRLVLWSPVAPPGMWLPEYHLSDDGIHPNPRGTRYLARTVADALVELYGDDIRARKR